MMTVARFRTLALALPEAVEGAHMDHPDFRVRGKIFASLGPGGSWGMVKLTREQQAEVIREMRGAAAPANGTWGARGATIVTIARAEATLVARALAMAWCNTAPKALVREWEGD